MNAAILMSSLLAGADPVPAAIPGPVPNPIAVMTAAPIGSCGGGCGSAGNCGEAPKCGACVGTGAADACKNDNKKPTLMQKIKDHFAKAGKDGDCKVDNCAKPTAQTGGGCDACGQTGGIFGKLKHRHAPAYAAPTCAGCAAAPVMAAPVHTPAPVLPMTPPAAPKKEGGEKPAGKSGVTIPQVLSPVAAGPRSGF